MTKEKSRVSSTASELPNLLIQLPLTTPLLWLDVHSTDARLSFISISLFSLPSPSRFIVSIFSSLKLPCFSVYSAHLIGWQNANLGWIYCSGEVITQLSGFELCLSHCLVIITVFLYFPSIFPLSQWLYHSLFPKNLTLFSHLLNFASLYTHMHTHTIWNLPQFPAKISTNLHLDPFLPSYHCPKRRNSFYFRPISPHVL